MSTSTIVTMIFGIIFTLTLLAFGIPWWVTSILWIAILFIFDFIVPYLDKKYNA